MDLIIRNANLQNGIHGIDIGIKDGKITELETALVEKSEKEIDATGCIVCPPFVDAHFHMDATFTLEDQRFNQSGTLLEGIALWSELKSNLTLDTIKEICKQTTFNAKQVFKIL